MPGSTGGSLRGEAVLQVTGGQRRRVQRGVRGVVDVRHEAARPAPLAQQSDQPEHQQDGAGDHDGRGEVEGCPTQVELRLLPVPDVVSSLNALAAPPGVPEQTAAAREAARSCAGTRAPADASPRRRPSHGCGAQASAALEGANLPVDLVRDLMRARGAGRRSPTPWSWLAVCRRRPAETEHVSPLLRTAPLQRLHGRRRHRTRRRRPARPRQQGGAPSSSTSARPVLPRRGTGCPGLVEVLLAGEGVPAVVVAAVVHAEIAHVRPFVRGNGVVARAMERAVIHSTGLDPTGVVVPEAGHGAQGGPAYLGALAAYGTPRGACPVAGPLLGCHRRRCGRGSGSATPSGRTPRLTPTWRLTRREAPHDKSQALRLPVGWGTEASRLTRVRRPP